MKKTLNIPLDKVGIKNGVVTIEVDEGDNKNLSFFNQAPTTPPDHMLVLKMKIDAAWRIYLSALAKADTMRDDGYKLHSAADKLHAQCNEAWRASNEWRLDRDIILAAGSRAYAEGMVFRAEGNDLEARGSQIIAAADKLEAEAHLTFCDVILNTIGNGRIRWREGNSVEIFYHLLEPSKKWIFTAKE